MGQVVATVEFTLERETKNTVRFQEVDRPDKLPVIGTLYVQKGNLPTPFPAKLKVTVEVA